jgi:DNA-binding transcriptional LysR family regulator
MPNMQWAERIGRRLKLRDLHVLLAAVEAGSMAKAARRLAVSQPVVSQAIADLEHTLGVRLVDRHRRGLEPTPYGRALLNHSLVAFDALRQGVKELEFLANPGVGELRIGCPEWITAGLLPVIIDELVKQHPRLTFHVQNTIPATSEFRELRQRTIDLVVGRIAHPFREDDLQADILYQEHLSVVVGTNSPWARRRKVNLADLVDERWILLPQNKLPGSLVADAFRARGLKPPEATVSAFSIHMRDRLLATGRYVSIVPDSVLHFAGDRLSFRPLPVKLPINPRPVAAVTLRNRTLSPVAQLFIDCARKLTKSLGRASK